MKLNSTTNKRNLSDQQRRMKVIYIYIYKYIFRLLKCLRLSTYTIINADFTSSFGTLISNQTSLIQFTIRDIYF